MPVAETAPKSAAWIAVPVVLAGLNLRPLFASLPPLVADVRADLGLSAAAAGLLTTGPLICLGLLAPLAPVLARRLPVERLLVACCLVTAAGTAARGLPGVAPLYAGTLTGAFSMSLVAGATVAAFLAIPLADAFGSWRASLAFWAIPAAAAAGVWLPAALRSRQAVRARRPDPPWRSPLAWSIAAFFGLQSMGFYSSTSWLPEILQSSGISEGRAGTLNAISNLVQILPAFAVPAIAARRISPMAVLFWLVVTSLLGLAGVLFAPGAALAWMVLLGIGQGAALGLGLILPVLRGRSAAEVASLTAMAMGVGYLIASAGPALVGAVRDATGGWDAPLVVLLAMTALQYPAGLYAAKGRPT